MIIDSSQECSLNLIEFKFKLKMTQNKAVLLLTLLTSASSGSVPYT